MNKSGSEQNKTNEFDNKKLLLSVFLLFSAIGIFWFAIHEDENSNDENEFVSVQKNEDSVNKHLRKTSQKIEAQKINAQIENYTKAPALNETSTVNKYEASSHSLDFKPDPRMNELATTLGKDKKNPEPPKDPKEIVEAQLYDRQKWNEYQLSYRQTYAQKFIENARRDGWEIKLNDEFKIIKTKKIKIDQRPQLFPSPMAESAAGKSAN